MLASLASDIWMLLSHFQKKCAPYLKFINFKLHFKEVFICKCPFKQFSDPSHDF